jgi:hypothetical protein
VYAESILLHVWVSGGQITVKSFKDPSQRSIPVKNGILPQSFVEIAQEIIGTGTLLSKICITLNVRKNMVRKLEDKPFRPDFP